MNPTHISSILRFRARGEQIREFPAYSLLGKNYGNSSRVVFEIDNEYEIYGFLFKRVNSLFATPYQFVHENIQVRTSLPYKERMLWHILHNDAAHIAIKMAMYAKFMNDEELDENSRFSVNTWKKYYDSVFLDITNHSGIHGNRQKDRPKEKLFTSHTSGLMTIKDAMDNLWMTVKDVRHGGVENSYEDLLAISIEVASDIFNLLVDKVGVIADRLHLYQMLLDDYVIFHSHRSGCYMLKREDSGVYFDLSCAIPISYREMESMKDKKIIVQRDYQISNNNEEVPVKSVFAEHKDEVAYFLEVDKDVLVKDIKNDNLYTEDEMNLVMEKRNSRKQERN